jgi:NDP-sugar pyrophosphorylase family protein
MDSIILAGGLGKRLGELTKDNPKSLVDVAGRPVIDYLVDSLKDFYTKLGVRGKVYLTINPRHEKHFRSYKEDCNFPFLELVVEDPSVYDPNMGPMRGMYQAYINYVKGKNARDVMILAGDNLSSLDLFSFYEFYQQDKKRSVLAVFDSEDLKLSGDYGRVGLDERDWVLNFKDRASSEFSRYVNTTNYIFTDEDMQGIGKWLGDEPEGTPFEWLMKRGSTLQAYKFKGYWFDIGTLDKLEEANLFFGEKK